MSKYDGGCHCGNIQVWFETEINPSDITPRSCQCSFCRKHSTRALSDPNGLIHIKIKCRDDLSRYQFGTKSTEFLICANCGVYVSAYMSDEGKAYANVMANVLIHSETFEPGIPMNYGIEDELGKKERRRENWSPATLTFDS